MIGLSLSFCVKEILYGKKSLDDIDALIIAVRAKPGSDSWNEVIKTYKESYWKDFDNDLIDTILKEIQSKIYIPRVDIGDQYFPMIYGGGYWVNSVDEIVWAETLPLQCPPQYQNISISNLI